MTLQEMLQSPEAKKLYRELAAHFHPDRRGGNAEIMKRINSAKDKKNIGEAEAAIYKLYAKYLKKNEKEKQTFDYDDIAKKQYPRRKNLYFEGLVQELIRKLDDPKAKLYIITRRESNKFHYTIKVASNGKAYTAYVLDLDRFKSKKDITKAVIQSIMKVLK